MILDLLEDTGRFLDEAPASDGKYELVRLVADALRRYSHFMTEHPTTMFQSLTNSLSFNEQTAYPALDTLLHSWRRDSCPRPWLRGVFGDTSGGMRVFRFASSDTDDAITACCLTPVHCIAGYRNGIVRLWKMASSQLCAEWKLHQDDGPIWSLSADSTGDLLAVISIPESLRSGDGRYRFATVSIVDGEVLGTATLRGDIEDARMSPNGMHIAYFGDEDGVALLDHSGSEVARAVFGDKVISCEWIGNEALVVTTDLSWKVFISNPWTNEIWFEAEIEPPARSPLKEAGLNLRGISTAMSSDQRWLAVGIAGGFTRVYDVNTGAIVADQSPFEGDGVLELEDCVVCARCLRFSEDGQWLFEGRSRRINAWDPAPWNLVGQWQSRVGLVGRFAEAENSLFAITDVRETAMRFEDTIQIAAEELPRQLPLITSNSAFTVPGSIIGVQISPSGRFCAIAWGPTFQFVTVRLIDLNSGAVLREITREPWPVAIDDVRVMYCLGESPPRVQIETLVDGHTLSGCELPGKILDYMFVSLSGRHLVCLTIESRKRPKSPNKTVTVRDDATGRTFQMPEIELPPSTPFEARHGLFDSFAYATIIDMSDYSTVWQECIGENRVRYATLSEEDNILEVEWNSGERHWKSRHAIPSRVLGKSSADTSKPISRYSLEPSGPFTAVRDVTENRVIAWWPARFRTFAGSRDGYTWVGSAEGSSFATAFEIELTNSEIEPSEEC